MNSPLKSLHKYSYREFQYFPNDGFRHEIIDGDHYMSPAPSTKHQTVSRRLQFQIYSQVELTGLGQIFNAPTDVELAPHDIVEPDLIVVMNDRISIITPSRILGVPHLVIEILSPSNPNHDRVLKFEMYARTGVAEYWIVDPEEETVAQWVLQDGDYKLLGTHCDSFRCHSIQEISIDLARVWQ